MKNITTSQISKWRPVSTASARLAANACHKGSDYGGSSKGDIYHNFERGAYNGSTKPDNKLFAQMMDALTSVHCRASERLSADVHQLIKDYTAQ